MATDSSRALRREVRDQLRVRIDSRGLASAPPAERRVRVREEALELLRQRGTLLPQRELSRIVNEVSDEVVGFGPIEPLLRDPTVTEVMVNGPDDIFVEREGRIERVCDRLFEGEEPVMHLIERIVGPLGLRVDQASPWVDARLPDGSRVHAIVPPLSLRGPTLTIRKFSPVPITPQDLLRSGSIGPRCLRFLTSCVRGRANIVISGGAGSGKTTMLGVLAGAISDDERLVTIEDAAELQLRQEHVVTLESRPANIEGLGEIAIRDLLRNALHMRPDRIIVGECRGGEALDMLQAMTTGQDGSLSTGHANSPRDMLSRLETMVLMTGYELPLSAIREQIASAVDLIVHTARLKDGTRKVVNITEVYGVEDDEILTQDVFVFDQTGVIDGKIQGRLKPTGIRPTFMGQFRASGVELPPEEFGIPPLDPARPGPARKGKGRWVTEGTVHTPDAADASRPAIGFSQAVTAGGMVYISSMGPVDPETGKVVGATIKEQTRQCLHNLKARLETAGSSLDKVVWATWSLRDPAEFDSFHDEWTRWFDGESPVGQGGLMPSSQRRQGFRVSVGVIAEA